MGRTRFGFLTYGLDRPALGIARSVLELGRALQSLPECDPVFLTPYARGPFATPDVPHAHLRGAGLLPALMTLGALEIPAVARRHALPLVHDPCGVSPFLLGRWAGGYKRIVTLHDAIAYRYPEGYTWLNNALHRRYVPATLRNVDAVITVSEAARDDLHHYLRIPAEKLHVVPWAAGPAFRPMDPAAAQGVAARYGLTAPFILYVGALEQRKNVTTLLRAFARLRERLPDVRLGIVGRARWKSEEIGRTFESLALGDAVRFTGYVPEADLPGLYAAASVFCYPSLHEGFGLPVLEAMSCGTPVVCARAASLPEVAGEAALLFDPLDVAQLAEALEAVLGGPALAAQLRRAGLARAATFSWRSSAERTLAVYRHVLAG